MAMKEFTITELSGLITVSAGAIATILFALQKSRCTHIRCCGIQCIRNPKPEPPSEQLPEQLPADNP
jgi:hypothetical protein